MVTASVSAVRSILLGPGNRVILFGETGAIRIPVSEQITDVIVTVLRSNPDGFQTDLGMINYPIWKDL